MIDEAMVKELKKWFKDYVQSFYGKDSSTDANVLLKEQHTYRVCYEITELAKNLSLSPELFLLAETAALFHDLGRFEQYEKYRTFFDKKSENHALLGIKIIERFGLLANFQPAHRQLLIDAISSHNLAEIPETYSGARLLLAQMLRDADKLDIWKVVTDYYSADDGFRNRTLELELPDEEEITPAILQDILAGRIIKNTSLKTLNDFKLLQMAWVFDLNFVHSFNQVIKGKYLDVIRDSVSDKEKSALAFARIQEFIEKKLAKGAVS
jgi:putative nucleotidyltransferase with HDIG domain